MNATSMSTAQPHQKSMGNRHIVDQLSDIRAQIKELKKDEAACVSKISQQMGDGDSLGGDQFIARQIISTRKGSVDTARLAADGIDVDAYRKPETIAYSLRLEARVREVA